MVNTPDNVDTQTPAPVPEQTTATILGAAAEALRRSREALDMMTDEVTRYENEHDTEVLSPAMDRMVNEVLLSRRTEDLEDKLKELQEEMA